MLSIMSCTCHEDLAVNFLPLCHLVTGHFGHNSLERYTFLYNPIFQYILGNITITDPMFFFLVRLFITNQHGMRGGGVVDKEIMHLSK